MVEDSMERGIAAIGLLHEPVRRALYRYVAAQAHEVSRNEAAQALGIQRGLAAFHLDKLVEAGLLEVASHRRLGGRSGPGAGRPAKLYRRSATEHELTLPPRRYETAAHLLAEVVEASGTDLALYAAAKRHGEALGREATAGNPAASEADAEAVLAERGYEPYREGATLRLRNCPFHSLSSEFPALVCGMNLALLEGLLRQLGPAGAELVARMVPRPGECCVALSPSKTSRN
ncbi:MAG TPA: helix-turn-helix domain-containing protein [Actinomycetota bacterium]